MVGAMATASDTGGSFDPLDGDCWCAWVRVADGVQGYGPGALQQRVPVGLVAGMACLRLIGSTEYWLMVLAQSQEEVEVRTTIGVLGDPEVGQNIVSGGELIEEPLAHFPEIVRFEHEAGFANEVQVVVEAGRRHVRRERIAFVDPPRLAMNSAPRALAPKAALGVFATAVIALNVPTGVVARAWCY